MWETDSIIDTAIYTHSTSSNAQQVTVNSGGDYFLVYNDSFTSSDADSNTKVTVQVNGNALSGAEVKTHYISSSSGHAESSGSLVYLLENLLVNDVVSVTVVEEAASGTVNADNDALLLLWKKSATYQISGAVTAGGSPLEGVTVTLSGDSSSATTTDASGNYAFSGILDGSSYTVTPTFSGYSFSPTSSSGTLSADTTHDFTGTVTQHTISGTITEGGSPLAGVTVTLTGDSSDSTTTDASGNYSFNVDHGSNYTVTPTLSGYTFAPLSSSGVLEADVTHDFTASLCIHTISGNITLGGSPLSGVTVNLSGDISNSTTTDASGNYTLSDIPHNTSYTITPTLNGHTFSPVSSSGTLSDSDITHNFTATLNSYTVSGTITDGGSPFAGVTVVLGGDVVDLTTTDASGNYSFTLNYGTDYIITPSSTGYSFTPTSSGSGTVSGNTTHDFSATAATYTISGTITKGGAALPGVTITLTGDSSDSTTTDGSGNYSFTGLPYNTSYTVTPTLSGYTFSPTSVSGTLTASADHDFTATLNTYSISGTIQRSGAGLSGVTVALSGGVSASTTTDTSGNYSFINIEHGKSYTVTPTLTGHTFSPVSTSGTLTAAADHDFTAIPNTYSISGTITAGGSPMTGVTVTLSGDASGSTTTDGSGNYSFANINHGSSYLVTPAYSDYYFSPATAVGTLTGTATHNFTGSQSTAKTALQTALLHGTQTTI